ncbi:secretin N-terminal domain-containing protein [Dickeya fangzhongdai]|uniref:secretin N-terminal domain-containing protein n=1 Tax=Dickeya fangzhongdai TaxID=1778540 RepID=UPI0026E07C8E|nr:secretin N-terminal domain-containing protein [Dickeya fangzhongdai]WKV51059.1 hypothetical protein PL145_01940 [Dickeya fangzhongdai]
MPKSTGKPIVISPDVTGTINVFSADVSDEQLPAFFTSVLRANGFDLSPGNPSVITKMTHSPYEYPETMNQADYDALKLPPVPAGKSDGTFLNARSDDNLITETYPVNHVRAQDLAPVVDAFLKTTGSTGKAFPFDGANLIAVSASPSQHARLKRFLPDIDKSVDQVFIQSLMFEVSEGESFDFSFASGSQSGHRLAGGVNTDRLSSALSSAGGAFGILTATYWP